MAQVKSRRDASFVVEQESNRVTAWLMGNMTPPALIARAKVHTNASLAVEKGLQRRLAINVTGQDYISREKSRQKGVHIWAF